MGTNYYWYRTCAAACAHCKAGDALHIGKSSMGWSFSFQGFKQAIDGDVGPILSYQDWLKVLESLPGRIEDEYGRPITLEDFKKLVEAKRGALNHARLDSGQGLSPAEQDYMRQHPRDFQFKGALDGHTWLDSEGNSFSEWDFS